MSARRCPCDTGLAFEVCCGAIHAGTGQALTAEQLMRSRYSAFAVGDGPYLERSWHSSTRPRRVRVDAADEWVLLEIVDTQAGGPLDNVGMVEFRAHHRRGGQPGVVHERSSFAREDGRWVYVGAM